MFNNKHLFTVAPGQDFTMCVVRGLLARLADGPAEMLARTTLILPSKRAIELMRVAFPQIVGREAGFLPRFVSFEHLESLLSEPLDSPPAISRSTRIIQLTRLVEAFVRLNPHFGGEANASAMTREINDLIDMLQAHSLSHEAIAKAVEQDEPAHREKARRFMGIITKLWPELLAAQGLVDSGTRRWKVLEALSRQWRKSPPEAPILLAGSTGSTELISRLIELVVQLEMGAVILPGLDRQLDSESWQSLGGDAPNFGHSQYGFFRLLQRLSMKRSEVMNWHEVADESDSARSVFVTEALRPAPVSDSWRRSRKKIKQSAHSALKNWSLIEAKNPSEEALAVALALRETLEEKGKRAALITRSPSFAQRVTTELARWNIKAQDSTERPLSLTPPAVFAFLALSAAQDRKSLVALLTLLRHPLIAVGEKRSGHMRWLRQLELLLRNKKSTIRVELTEDEIRLLLSPIGFSGTNGQEAQTLLQMQKQINEWQSKILPLANAFQQKLAPLPELLLLHLQFLDNLCAPNSPFLGHDGEKLKEFFDRLLDASSAADLITPKYFPQLLRTLMAGELSRPDEPSHSRLFIWGAWDARMLQADRVIIAGLNEGTWPNLPAPGPWLSPQIMQKLGLPPPEYEVGLAALDFQHAISTSELILTRSLLEEGDPTIPSRWLTRIETLLGGCAGDVLDRIRENGRNYLSWAVQLNTPHKRLQKISRPAPKPSLKCRPKHFSATQISSLICDPYSIYVGKILRLSPLEWLGAPEDALIRGSFFHAVLEYFGESIKKGAEIKIEKLTQFADELFAGLNLAEATITRWRSRLIQFGHWFIKWQARRQGEARIILLEGRGEMVLDELQPPVTLTSRADRIDIDENGFQLIDYKTGQPSNRQEVLRYDKQMPVMAMIAEAGGFAEELPITKTGKMSFVQIAGGDKGGEELQLDKPQELIEDTRLGLTKLFRAYEQESTPYYARANGNWIKYRDRSLEHLQRVDEWLLWEDL